MRVTEDADSGVRLFLALLGTTALGMMTCWFCLWRPLLAEVWPP
jgi:hypothetical protein